MMTATADTTSPHLRLSEGRGRWVLAATVLGSSMAMLDGTVVNVALPRIGESLGAALARPAVDGQRLHADAGRADPAGRLARRPARPPADLPGRRGLVRAGLALCGAGAEHRAADRRPGRCRASAGRCSRPGCLAILQASFRPRGPGPGDRRLVGPGRRRRRDRPVRWAAGWSRRPAGGGSSCSTCRWPRPSCAVAAAARARDPRPERRPASSTSPARRWPRSAWAGSPTR